MKIFINPERETWSTLLQRPVMNLGEILPQVSPILEAVRLNGDAALRQFTQQFDGVSLNELAVSQEEKNAAGEKLSPALKDAINLAANNIKRFHQSQVQSAEPVQTMPGVLCWRKSVGIPSVGLYIPGGSAPLFSTVLMLGIPAAIAGCSSVVVCSPPQPDGSMHPAILYAAQVAGISKIYKVGGAQAIAALCFGTASIQKVDKIFGPGNQYVTAAKMLVQQYGTAIDMPAGPSEVCVLADDDANPAWVASDLLSQAEHGPDSQVVLIASPAFDRQQLLVEIENQLEILPRAAVAKLALQNSCCIVLDNLENQIDIINEYAPEHLILAISDAKPIADKIINAGSVFLGHWSPESVGDYASGTNHTLPTNGYARAYSGVSVDSFVKKITYQQLSKEGLAQLAPAVIAMATAEGLDAHAEAVRIRLK